MKEESNGLWLRQTEHVRGHLWHKYSVTSHLIGGFTKILNLVITTITQELVLWLEWVTCGIANIHLIIGYLVFLFKFTCGMLHIYLFKLKMYYLFRWTYIYLVLSNTFPPYRSTMYLYICIICITEQIYIFYYQVHFPLSSIVQRNTINSHLKKIERIGSSHKILYSSCMSIDWAANSITACLT